MTIGGSIFLIVVGAILKFAMNVEVAQVNLDTVGMILMIAGGVGLILGFVQEGMARKARREAQAGGAAGPGPAPGTPRGHLSSSAATASTERRRYSFATISFASSSPQPVSSRYFLSAPIRSPAWTRSSTSRAPSGSAPHRAPRPSPTSTASCPSIARRRAKIWSTNELSCVSL